MEAFPREPGPEEIDGDIEKLLEELDRYGELYNEGGPELQDEWYVVEMEAKVAKDRQAAKAHLEVFLGKLKNLQDKS